NGKIFLPRFRVRRFIGDIKNFSATNNAIAIGPKILRQRHRVWNEFAKAMQVSINPGGGWPQTRDERDARRIAQRRGAIGVSEKHSAFCEPVDIRRLSLWMAAHHANPIVHVIDGDEQNFWFRGAGLRAAAERSDAEEKQNRARMEM